MHHMAAGGGGWISLPAELLKEVSDRLRADTDQIHIRQVCAHWRASTAPLAALRPWVVAAHDRHRDPFSAVNPVGEHSLWLPRGGSDPRMDPRAPAPAGLPYCCGTPCGWLALTDHLRSPTRLILWEPLSKAEIPLPTLATVAQVFLSGDPLASPGCRWMAIASQKIPGAQIGQRLFFWRPGDAGWVMQLEYPNGRIEGAAFHNGRFYVSSINMSLDIFDLQHHPPNRLRRICLYAPLQARYPRYPGNPIPHAVACNNQMLLVIVYRGPRQAVILAEVHRPDWDADRLDLREHKVSDLGDYSLFLGRGDTLALSANEFPAIRRNCVYFVEHDTYKHEQWVVVFDLGSNDLERIPHPQEHLEGGGKSTGWLAYSWFCPRRPFLGKQAL
ncbi:uncharacterized protein LOC125525263 [Triticum urartu]|nr:uncharacterized protein LOC125525263 [Triticum urartu]